MKKYIVVFGLFFAGMVFALAISRPAVVGTPAQAQTSSMNTGGRFQLVALPNNSPMVIDTVTGRVWRINSANNWEYQGSPERK